MNKILKRIPVSVYEGDVIINPSNLGNLIIQPSLSNEKNGVAVVEIQNPTDKSISITV